MSAEQQAQAQRNSILDELDGTFGKAVGNRTPSWRARGVIVLAAVSVLMVGVAASVWLIKDRVHDVVLANAAPAVAPVAEPGPPLEVEESVAAVLQDAPPAHAAAAPIPAPVTVAAPVLPPKEQALPAKPEVLKAAKPAPVLVAKQKTVEEPVLDRDEALLEALVMHTKTNKKPDNKPAPKPAARVVARAAAKPLRLESQLKQCKALSARRAEHCRRRICAAAPARKGACKAVPAAGHRSGR